jgi:hypothetical protein
MWFSVLGVGVGVGVMVDVEARGARGEAARPDG